MFFSETVGVSGEVESRGSGVSLARSSEASRSAVAEGEGSFSGEVCMEEGSSSEKPKIVRAQP